MLNKKIEFILKILWIPLLVFIIIKSRVKEEGLSIKEKPLEIVEEIIPEIKKEEGLVLLERSFEQIENFSKDDLEMAKVGFLDSCSKIMKEQKEFLSNSQIKINTKTYQKICDELRSSNISFRDFIKEKFTPFLVMENDNEFGKFTSYYESRINVSLVKTSKYKYPIYGTPKDLISIKLQDFDSSLPNKTFVGQVKDQNFIKYYTRKDIYNSNSFNAPIILWTDDYVDLFVMQIQGSAIGTLPSGDTLRISYANNNGHSFKGIGSILLSKGLLKQGEASMGGIKKWLKDEKNQKVAFENMFENERYIFHQITKSDGPIGAQGVAVRAGRSLAVDTQYVPLGSLLWLDTTGPSKEPIQKLMVAQDVGSAIKGVVRGDYFWGSGDDEILDYAGKMNSSGRYYILLPKTGVN